MVGADGNDKEAADELDEPTASKSGPAAEDDNSIERANVEKIDEILDEAGVNEGIAAGSRETHPDEG